MTARSDRTDKNAPASPAPGGAAKASSSSSPSNTSAPTANGPAPSGPAPNGPASNGPARAPQTPSQAFYTPDAATRLMSPLDESSAAPGTFDPAGATTVQPVPISLGTFDSLDSMDIHSVDALPDAPSVTADDGELLDPFDGQETQVDYHSYASEEATGAFVHSHVEPERTGVPISIELPAFDEEDVTDTRLSPPPIVSDVGDAPDAPPTEARPAPRPATGCLLVDEPPAGTPWPLPPPLPAPPDAPTMQLAALPESASFLSEEGRAPRARAVPLPPTPSQFRVPVPTDAARVGDTTSSASGRPVELERWRVVPTLFTKPDETGAPHDATSLPDLSAAQTVLWSLADAGDEVGDDVGDDVAAEDAPRAPADRTVIWRPDTDDAEEPTGAEPASLLDATQPASPEGGIAPSAAAARAASAYISDGVAYLRSLHAFAEQLDEEARREFTSRALGAAEKLRRALALLSAAPLDDDSQDEP